MAKSSNNKRKYILISILIIVVVSLGVTGIILRNKIFEPFNLESPHYLYIDDTKDFENVIGQLNKMNLPSEKVFRIISDRMRYPHAVKSGRYEVVDGMTMIDVVRMLRSGNQKAVNLTFNNIRTEENLAGRISNQLMLDSVELLNALSDRLVAEKYGFDENTFVSMFIPNTYQVFWDTGVDNLLKRMKREYNSYWSDDRKAKADRLGLTPIQVSILASIVEEEATYADEYPIVAGLYLNRLERGMKLEADPTVKYAIGDFALRRILFRHLEVESPYNTYRVEGLPPGPIRVPSVAAIDATLSPQSHKYLFMCAKDDLSGRHNFAVTHAEHARNAARYQRALNERGIYR